MRIFLTGASGFVGGHLLRVLYSQGYQVSCLVRPESRKTAAFKRGIEALPKVQIIKGEWTHPEQWIDTVAGHDVVINTVGVIRETRQASFAQVHTYSAMALFEAAAQAKVGKIIQISALGADEMAQSGFHRSKRAADQYLVRLGIPYVILRPSFIYGPGDHSMAFFTRLARLPLTPVPGDGRYRVQPLSVSDLTRAILTTLQNPDLTAVVADIGGGEVLTFNALLDRLARQAGKRRGARKWHIPWSIMSLLANLTTLVGDHGPITSEELAMLRRENFTPDATRFAELFGFTPQPFDPRARNVPLS